MNKISPEQKFLVFDASRKEEGMIKDSRDPSVDPNRGLEWWDILFWDFGEPKKEAGRIVVRANGDKELIDEVRATVECATEDGVYIGNFRLETIHRDRAQALGLIPRVEIIG